MGVVRRGSALRSEIAERGLRFGVMAEKLDRHCLPAVPVLQRLKCVHVEPAMGSAKTAEKWRPVYHFEQVPVPSDHKSPALC